MPMRMPTVATVASVYILCILGSITPNIKPKVTFFWLQQQISRVVVVYRRNFLKSLAA